MAYGYNFADFLSEALGMTGKHILSQNEAKRKAQQQAIQDEFEWWYKNQIVENDKERTEIAKRPNTAFEAYLYGSPSERDAATTWESLTSNTQLPTEASLLADKMKSDPTFAEQYWKSKLGKRSEAEDFRGRMDVVNQFQDLFSQQQSRDQSNTTVKRNYRFDLEDYQSRLAQAQALADQQDDPTVKQYILSGVGAAPIMGDTANAIDIRGALSRSAAALNQPQSLVDSLMGSVAQQATGMPENKPQFVPLQTGTMRSGGQPTTTQQKSGCSREELIAEAKRRGLIN